MDAFLSALSELGTVTYWLSLAIAITIGTIVGFIPGVGATLVTAIMLPPRYWGHVTLAQTRLLSWPSGTDSKG